MLMDLGLFSQCIWKWRRRKTRRLPRAGKRMRMESLYSCVSIIQFGVSTNSMAIDRFILCCCRIVNFSIDSGYSPEPTGHLQLLPREHISDSYRSRSTQYFQFPSCFSTSILPTNLRSLGERTLVPELGNQSYMCSACDVAAAMGTKISQGHSVTLQSAQARSNSGVPFRRG